MQYLTEQCDLQSVDELSPSIVKKKLRYKKVSYDSNWQVIMAKELLEVRNREVMIEGFSDEEVNSIFDYVCTE